MGPPGAAPALAALPVLPPALRSTPVRPLPRAPRWRHLTSKRGAQSHRRPVGGVTKCGCAALYIFLWRAVGPPRDEEEDADEDQADSGDDRRGGGAGDPW